MITLGFCPTEQRWCWFDRTTRIWYVTQRLLGDIHEACRRDPLWAEGRLLEEVGPGPVSIVVGKPDQI